MHAITWLRRDDVTDDVKEYIMHEKADVVLLLARKKCLKTNAICRIGTSSSTLAQRPPWHMLDSCAESRRAHSLHNFVF
jgi:hypothetical protein